MNLDSIKNNTTWEDAASSINSNFSKTNLEVAKIASSSNKHKGFFTTEAALLVAQPYPRVGDNAYVGATYPGVVYVCNITGVWTATTTVPSPPAVNISEYYKKAETDTLIDTVEANIASLETDLNTVYQKKNAIDLSESIISGKLYDTTTGLLVVNGEWSCVRFYCYPDMIYTSEARIENAVFYYLDGTVGSLYVGGYSVTTPSNVIMIALDFYNGANVNGYNGFVYCDKSASPIYMTNSKLAGVSEKTYTIDSDNILYKNIGLYNHSGAFDPKFTDWISTDKIPISSAILFRGGSNNTTASDLLFFDSSGIFIPGSSKKLTLNTYLFETFPVGAVYFASSKTKDNTTSYIKTGPKVYLVDYSNAIPKKMVFNYNKWLHLLNTGTIPNSDSETWIDKNMEINPIFNKYGFTRCIKTTFSSVGNWKVFNLSSNTFRQEFISNKYLSIKALINCDFVGNFKLSAYYYTSTAFNEYSSAQIYVGANSTKVVQFDCTLPSGVDINSVQWIGIYLINVPIGTVRIARFEITDFFVSGAESIPSVNDMGLLLKPTNNYIGSKVLYVGDSISTLDNYKWKGILQSKYGLVPCSYTEVQTVPIPPAIGGITLMPPITEDVGHESIWYRCSAQRMVPFNPNLISLFGGTNDSINASILIGATTDVPYVDSLDGFSTEKQSTLIDVRPENLTYASSLMGCIEMLQRDFINIEIILATVMASGSPYGTSIYSQTGRTVGEEIAYITMLVAKKYNLKCVPLYWCTGITLDNYMLFKSDVVHPSLNGALRISSLYAQTLSL